MENLKYNPWYYTIDNMLIKKQKPFKPGDMIHIINKNGCFKVIDVKLSYFTVMKNREEIKITWDKFACLKGEGTSLEAQVKRGLNQAIYRINCSTQQNNNLLKELELFIKDLKKK